jgi:hypothetical protein
VALPWTRPIHLTAGPDSPSRERLLARASSDTEGAPAATAAPSSRGAAGSSGGGGDGGGGGGGGASKTAVGVGLVGAAVLLLVTLKATGFDVQAAVKVTRIRSRSLHSSLQSLGSSKLLCIA